MPLTVRLSPNPTALEMHVHVNTSFRAELLELNTSEHEIVDPLDSMKREPAVAAYITQVQALYVLLRTESQFRQQIILCALHGNRDGVYRNVERYHSINRHIDSCMVRCREYRSQIPDPTL